MPDNTKELAWSFTLDDTQFLAAVKKAGLSIKNFDKLLAETTKTAKSLQTVLGGLKLPTTGGKQQSFIPPSAKSDAKAAEDSIRSLRAENIKYKKELEGLTAAQLNNSVRARELAASYAENQGKIKVFNDSIKQTGQALATVKFGTLQKQFKALGIDISTFSKEQLKSIKITKDQAVALDSNVDSYNRLRASLTVNKKILKSLSQEQIKSEKVGEKLEVTIKKQDANLKKFGATIGEFQGFVGNYTNSIRKVAKELNFLDASGKATFGSLTNGFGQVAKSGLALGGSLLGVGGAILALQQVVRLAKEATGAMSEFSDVAANVQKTTGLTDQQFTKLSESLKKIDTRTALNELLAFAEAGGRFQVPQEELAEFATTVDKVFVALEADLSGSADEIALDLAKISDSFVGINKLSISEGVLRVGGAINQLAQTTKAQAQPILDYAKNLIGLNQALELTPDAVLGLATVFNTAGIEASVAATATNQLLLALGKNTQQAADVAGVAFEEFADLVNTKPLEALNKFATGLVTTGSSLTSISDNLEGFGLQGQKVSRLLFALGKNQEDLAKFTEAARKELETGNSVLEEAATRNKTLAAELEKFSKGIKDTFADLASSREFADFIKQLNTDLIPILSDLIKILGGTLFIAVKTLNVAFKLITGTLESLNTIFRLLTGIDLSKLTGEVFNLTKETKDLSFWAIQIREVFDLIAGSDLSKQLEDSRKQLELTRKTIAKKFGFESWELYKKNLDEITASSKEAKQSLADLRQDFANIKIPDLDISIDQKNVTKIENEIERLADLKILLAKKTQELVRLPSGTGVQKEDVRVALDAQKEVESAIKTLTQRLTAFRIAEAETAEKKILQVRLDALTRSLKDENELRSDQFAKDLATLEASRRKGLEIEGGYINAKKELTEKFNSFAIAKEKEFLKKQEEERLKAVDRFSDVGKTRLTLLEEQQALELEALRIHEINKTDLGREYEEIRAGIKQEFAEQRAEIETAEAEARRAKIEEENQLLIDTAEGAVDGIANAFSQLFLEGAKAEEVFKSLAKSAGKWAIDTIAATLKVALRERLIQGLSAKASVTLATATAGSLTAAYTTPATLATIATLGAAAAAAPPAIGAALAAVSGIVGTSSAFSGGSGGSLGQFNNTGGLESSLSNVQRAQGPGDNEILGQLQTNAFNAANAEGGGRISVSIISADPNTEVAISNARGQVELVSSGYNIQELE